MYGLKEKQSCVNFNWMAVIDTLMLVIILHYKLKRLSSDCLPLSLPFCFISSHGSGLWITLGQIRGIPQPDCSVSTRNASLSVLTKAAHWSPPQQGNMWTILLLYYYLIITFFTHLTAAFSKYFIVLFCNSRVTRELQCLILFCVMLFIKVR